MCCATIQAEVESTHRQKAVEMDRPEKLMRVETACRQGAIPLST